MRIKTTRLALALVGALSLAAPLALSATPAEAAPHGGGMMMGGGHDNNMGGHQDAFHDRNHRPPLRAEQRPRQPHGHYRWRTGNWGWSHNQWTWQPGIWIRF